MIASPHTALPDTALPSAAFPNTAASGGYRPQAAARSATGRIKRPTASPRPACPSTQWSDQRLLAGLKSPSEATRRAAWGTWYRRDHAKLAAYVCRRSAGMHCGDAAEDIVQEAFVIAFRHISGGTYEDRGRALMAYLYGIAGNLLRSTRRRQQRSAVDDSVLDFTPDRTLPVSDQVLVAEVLEAVRASYARLPVHQRDVIDGLYGEETTSHELGPVLGKTAVNVRTIAHRAVKSICQRLADEHDLHLSTDAVRLCLQMM